MAVASGAIERHTMIRTVLPAIIGLGRSNDHLLIAIIHWWLTLQHFGKELTAVPF